MRHTSGTARQRQQPFAAAALSAAALSAAASEPAAPIAAATLPAASVASAPRAAALASTALAAAALAAVMHLESGPAECTQRRQHTQRLGRHLHLSRRWRLPGR